MITKLNLKGRIALITSILLLALWAPITTHAQPNAEPESGKHTIATDVHECEHCKLLHSAKGRPCPHAHQHSNSKITDFENMVGFAEVDPAALLFENMDLDVGSLGHEVNGEYVGFAEVDPADFGAPAALITPQLAERPAWKNPVGFAETDPADLENVKEVIPNEILVACQHMGTSSSYSAPTEISELTSLEDQS